MSAKDLIIDARVGSIVAAGTTGTGGLMDWIPGDIGKLAALIGIALSLVLLYANILNIRKSRLELSIMERKEAERERVVNERKKAGLPARRKGEHS